MKNTEYHHAIPTHGVPTKVDLQVWRVTESRGQFVFEFLF
jgi:hypothetical protein